MILQRYYILNRLLFSTFSFRKVPFTIRTLRKSAMQHLVFRSLPYLRRPVDVTGCAKDLAVVQQRLLIGHWVSGRSSVRVV